MIMWLELKRAASFSSDDAAYKHFLSLLLQVFVNFAKQQSREDDAIVLHPKAAGAQRYIDTTPLKNLGK